MCETYDNNISLLHSTKHLNISLKYFVKKKLYKSGCN